MTYRATNGIWDQVVTAEEAREAWESTPEYLRTGDLDNGFTLYAANAYGRPIRCAGNTYTPLAAEAHPAGHATAATQPEKE